MKTFYQLNKEEYEEYEDLKHRFDESIAEEIRSQRITMWGIFILNIFFIFLIAYTVFT